MNHFYGAVVEGVDWSLLGLVSADFSVAQSSLDQSGTGAVVGMPNVRFPPIADVGSRAPQPLSAGQRWHESAGGGLQPKMLTKQIHTAEKLLIGLDDRAGRFFEPYTDSPPIRALDLLSKLGDQPELRIIAGGLIVAGTFGGSARLVRAGTRMVIAHEAATLAKDLMKTEIDRTRPRSARGRKEKRPKRGNHTAKEKTSFPSGHSAGAIAAARAVSREFPEYRAAAVGAAGLIAASQIPRCAHYPTDVAAGVAIGLVIEAMTNAAWKAGRMDERSIGKC